ncbi:hypothetical protein OPT61_g9608 [Boeremia exigua]|uniref:Uncharacterized protein n=1 Tax=Boeremia exigua TaxID=749465 RepID=A0ACC2HTP4_9PLEO|nr:hypothetical protein OPT61_g9608 [Boeremia exigua]
MASKYLGWVSSNIVVALVILLSQLPWKTPLTGNTLRLRLQASEGLWRKSVTQRQEKIARHPAGRDMLVFPAVNEQIGLYQYTFWDLVPPSYNCPWELERVGSLGDGGKWVCGVSKYAGRNRNSTVVYSFGIEQETSFEEAMIRQTNSQIFAFDIETFDITFSMPGNESRVAFTPIGLGAQDAPKAVPPVMTLKSLMARNNHSYMYHLLFFKSKRMEFEALDKALEDFGQQDVPIGQMMIEVHLLPRERMGPRLSWFERLENAGFRPVPAEPNLYALTVHNEQTLPRYSEVGLARFWSIRDEWALRPTNACLTQTPKQAAQRQGGPFFLLSEGQSFVFKRVSKPFLDLSSRLAADFSKSCRLRMHVDLNEDENILIYPYYQHTLLGLLQEGLNVSDAARQKILRRTGEAIQELHSKDWIRIDIKPDNVLVNWTHDEEGTKTITDVALGDFDPAYKCETGALLQSTHAAGNSMWRNIYSFGLVCIYALGAGEVLLLNDYSYLVEHGITPEQEVLTRHFAYFGSANGGLLKHVDSKIWTKALQAASQVAEETVQEQPEMKFDVWGHELGTEAQKMIAEMTKIDPRARSTIDQVMTHAWWQELV